MSLSQRLWLRDPIAVLADGAERGLVVSDGVIVELVGRSGPQSAYDLVFDASRHVIIPGLVNAHHHFFQTLTRAHPRAINKKLFPWLQTLYPIWGRELNRGAFRLAVRVALAELLMSGCTTTTDHLFVFPADMPDAVDIEVEEARALGMRMALTRGAIDLGFEDGGIADRRLMQDHDTVLADCERVISLYHEPQAGSFTTVALAPCAPFNVTRRMMVETAALAAKHDCRLHTHLAETEDENDYCRQQFRCTPVEYLEDCGWLSNRTWLAHGVHFNEDEMRLLGGHGVSVCHCPTSNMLLASGMCRTVELEASGVSVGLGVDGSASNDSSNMMEAVRHAMLMGKLRYGADAVTHLDALRWGTRGSAECLGRKDIGTIAEGSQADLALFLLDDLRFSGAGDPLAALVLCGAHSADRVMVAGHWRVVDGQPVDFDLARLRSMHGEAAKTFL
ncbi:8-oxoguanine deaminase [Bradyrhizobium cenepequi]